MRRHGWVLAVGAAVGAALLVLLGTLQGRWLDQVAQTIAAQKRAALYRQGNAMATELERELTRAYLWFQLDDDAQAAGARPLDQLLGERLGSYRRSARHHGLLASVWLVEPGAGGGEPTLRRLAPGGALEAAPWPAALGELRAMLRDELRVSGIVATERERAWLAVPAVGAGWPGAARATVFLELDGRHLVRTLLPALAQQHRGPGDEGGPILARLEDADRRPIFAGIAGIAGIAGVAGAAAFRSGEHEPVVVLGARPELATAALLAGMQPPRRWPPEVVRHFRDGPRPPRHHTEPPPGDMFFHISPGPGHAGPPGAPPPGPPGLLPPPPGFGVQGMVRLPPPSGGPRRAFGPPGRPARAAPWRISAAFAAGPVDDVVTSLRRRNMALGFSILGLLGGAIAALTIAVRRAHALAERQREFMASMSHELRTPLAVIGSAAENLQDGTVDDPARVREYGGLIRAESRRLHGMVDDVLRLAAGRALEDDLRLRPVELCGLVDKALDSFAKELRARGGRIERSDPLGPIVVAADAEALRQAVENVVGNALKYGGERPLVSVRIAEVLAAAGHEVHVTVEDRGLGIPPEEVDHIFEPFFRGREAQRRQIRGTGLGLALVSRVMRAHGGGVSVESTAGRGSVFVLRLPAAPAGPPRRPA
jgi:signal transduction histidine kinase